MFCPNLTPEICVARDLATTPPILRADPDIAGIGIFISFIVTAGIAVILSLAIYYLQCFRRKQGRLAQILSRTLLGLSDQQLVTGIGIQIGGLMKICYLSSYHLGILFSLAILSTITHLMTLFALSEYFSQHKLARNIRITLMALNSVLLFATGILAIMYSGGYETLVMCYRTGHLKSNRLDGWAIAYLVCFSLFIAWATNEVFYDGLEYKVLGFPIIALVIYVLVSIMYFILYNNETAALGRSPRVRDPPSIMEGSETEWTYGQIFPILLLFLPILNGLEIYGEIQVAHDQVNGPITTSALTSETALATNAMPLSTHNDDLANTNDLVDRNEEFDLSEYPVRRQDTESLLEGRSSTRVIQPQGIEGRSSTFEMNDLSTRGVLGRRGTSCN